MRKTGSALGALALASLVLAGCGVKPVDFVRAPEQGPRDILCSKIITQNARIPFPVKPATPSAGDEAAVGWEVDYRDQEVGVMLEDMLSRPLPAAGALAPGEQPISQSVLILSGGSQQGAFGAGFLHQWASPPHDKKTGPRTTSEADYRLPRFRLVTGISTGALQSTFAFLNMTEVPVEEYSIASEGDLLKPLVKGKLEDNKLTAGRRLAKKGTLATLDPLRARLRKLIDHEIMMKVAAEAHAGRQLLVGAVEMGSGEMAVFDLTKAATLYAEGYPDSRQPAGTGANDHMRLCYIEALMASSSVPMAAAPVFIDNKMYIDGGARFGVMIDLTAGAYRKASITAAKDKAPRNLFILVNGTLEVPQLCRIGKCPVDANGKPKPPADEIPHEEWDFLSLAQRSLGVLINQSYRGSVFIADGQYRAKQFTTRFARLEPGHLTHPAAIDFPGAGSAEKTCWQWRQEDERIDKPMEFYPRFMRCLIDYGHQHHKVAEFRAAEPQHPGS